MPLRVPTVIVEPEVIAGRLIETVSVPAPPLSVVNVPTVVPFTTTSSELLAVAPVTFTVNELVFVPCDLVLVNVTVPVAELLESVKEAVSVVVCEWWQPPEDPSPSPSLSPVLVPAANDPLSGPTVTAAPAAMLVGKFDGSDCCEPVGLLENVTVPAPLASVVKVPIVTPPIAMLSAVFAASPETVTVRLVVELPQCPPVW